MESALFSSEMLGRDQLLMVHWIIVFINLTWRIIFFSVGHTFMSLPSHDHYLPSEIELEKNVHKKMEFAEGKTSDFCELAIWRQNLEKALIKNQKMCSWQNLKHELMLCGCILRRQFALPYISDHRGNWDSQKACEA